MTLIREPWHRNELFVIKLSDVKQRLRANWLLVISMLCLWVYFHSKTSGPGLNGQKCLAKADSQDFQAGLSWPAKPAEPFHRCRPERASA